MIDVTDTIVERFSARQWWALLRSTKRVNIWEGSVRSGKTVGSFPVWASHVRNGPRGVYFMIGKTMETLERNILLPIQDLYGKDKFDYNTYKGRGEFFGRQIDFVSAYDETSFKRIRGATVAGWYGDELTLWPETFFAELLHRMSPPGAKGIGTTNPDSPFHYLKQNYLNRIDELDWFRAKFRLDHNPFLSDEFVEALHKENVGLWYQRFILGLWVLAAGTVYSMFNEAKHVREVHDYYPKFGVAVDYGTANPTVFVLFGYGRGDGKVYVIDLYYYDGGKSGIARTDRQYAKDFMKFTSGINLEATVVDPSAKSFIAELQEQGVAVTWADNDVLPGIRFVSSLLQNGDLIISRRKECRPIVQEFGSYVWDENAQKKGEDRPVKQYDHTLDAIRYFLYTMFYEPQRATDYAIVT